MIKKLDNAFCPYCETSVEPDYLICGACKWRNPFKEPIEVKTPILEESLRRALMRASRA